MRTSLSSVPPGSNAAAEGPMQVESAAAAGAVQRFAHKIQPGAALELEMPVHLPQSKPAAGHLCLPPAAGGQPLKAPVLGSMSQPLPLPGGKKCRGGILQPGGRPQRPAELCVQQTQPESGGAVGGGD